MVTHTVTENTWQFQTCGKGLSCFNAMLSNEQTSRKQCNCYIYKYKYIKRRNKQTLAQSNMQIEPYHWEIWLLCYHLDSSELIIKKEQKTLNNSFLFPLVFSQFISKWSRLLLKVFVRCWNIKTYAILHFRMLFV